MLHERGLWLGELQTRACHAITFLLQPFPFHPIIARLFVMGGTIAQLPIGRQVSLPGISISLLPWNPPGHSAKASKAGSASKTAPSTKPSSPSRKLTANWQSVIEHAALTPGQREEKAVGQKQRI
jgi:hypothetical protein